MIFRQGQRINNGEVNILICDSKEYENQQYVYVLDEKNEEFAFYKVSVDNDIVNFEQVVDDILIQKLIIYFANIKEKINAISESE